MRQRFDRGRVRDIVLSGFLFATFIVAPPLLTWWARPERPWFLPYLVWGGIILMIYLIQRRIHNDL